MYGQAVVTNADRMLAITKAFSAFGAAEGDIGAATSPVAITSRRAKKLNDVAWRVMPDNFGNGVITQVGRLVG